MTNFYKVHAQSLAALQAEQGDACPSFQYAGKTYLCLPGGARQKKDLGIGGYSFDSELKLVCLASVFTPGLGAMKQQIIYLGQNYRIDQILFAPNGYQIELYCNDPSRGA